MSAPMKLPRTIRMDPSDTFVFAKAAEPGEWAVAGTFLFHGAKIADLGPKQRTAFRAGFLGIESFGYSTLAVASEVVGNEMEEATHSLAAQLVHHCGAPSVEVALPAAREEIAFAADLCRDHAIGTLLALHRAEEDGQIRERFRTLRPRAETTMAGPGLKGLDRAFLVIETDDDDDQPEEQVDLLSLGKE
ncbi:DUF6505 family protein [Georhizobium sp. MAB10]|uniref:DUF6505 family protein n=1 Tax=Georhizobium sp. MAB10 TaxID=3028319 RepID=UPI0038558AE9